ncbi:thaumatin-like protein 1b [Canna indica]|uniref:Thaumatin-like protein 1b n=1 Tax=Canna indica TaxID=4628 RepID=A0AAQ3JRW2_9LILI|nr:thaumatin-like protein 1b [Canna indica]
MSHMIPLHKSIPFLVALFLHFLAGGCVTFTFVNRCGDTIWPGVLSNSGSVELESTGFVLGAGASRSLVAPSGWSGRFWARTGCKFDEAGRGSCAIGDCGSGQVECKGAGAAPPATLAEFTLDGSEGKDFYDVSLVDGYNLPVLVEAAGGAEACLATGCLADINRRCPAELKVGDGEAAACRSACEAFGRPEFCCSGQFGNPNTCRPSAYSQMFKSACPRAYSYAYDDATSTFTCVGAQAYSITFCPESSPSQTSTKNTTPRTPTQPELEDDSWLASLAVGDASLARRRASSLMIHASLMAAVTISLLFTLL